MMIMNRKGMTMALGVIIAIVVLIVVALAVIAITTGSLSNFFGSTGTQQKQAALNAQCTTWFTQWCLNNPGVEAPTGTYPTYTAEDITVDCSSALSGRKCGAVTSAATCASQKATYCAANPGGTCATGAGNPCSKCAADQAC